MNDVQKAIEDQFRDVDSDNEVPDQIFERVTNVGGRGNSLSFCISMHMSIAIFRKKINFARNKQCYIFGTFG